MSAGARAHLRPLTVEDRDAVAAFSCRAYAEPWSDVIEEMVRANLVDAVEVGGVEACGLWAGGELVGVAAWRFTPGGSPTCHTGVLAVANGHRRRGHGRRPKKSVVAAARAADAVAVVSTVHWDNDAMIELNVALGANVERIDGDPDHCLCVIPL